MSLAKYELLPVEDIELDFNNPRITHYLEIYRGKITAEAMALALGKGSSFDGDSGPSFIVLQQSIKTNRGVIHPIIVNREASGRLVVIEGNTRTLIYREFKKSEKNGDTWDKIPAMVYDNMAQAEIDAIRLQAHLVGTREWDPYSKAKYLNFLRNKHHLPFSQLVDFCGGNLREINNYINAYNDMESDYREVLDSDQDFDPHKFSAFVELQSPRIIESIVRHGFNKKDFAKWVHEGKIYPLNTVRQLPRILQNEKSRELFLKRDAREAIKVLEVPVTSTELNKASLLQIANELSRRLGKIELFYVKKLQRETDDEERIALFYARDALVELCEYIGDEKK